MNDAEAFEVALLAAANAITAFTVYITFTTGYLAAAFFVGRKLTFTQAAIFSSLYVFSAISALLAMNANLISQSAAIAQSPSFPRGLINQSEFWLYYMSVLLVVGIVASLYFMWSIRSSEES
jgi:small-conductance mechanosensitive channel